MVFFKSFGLKNRAEKEDVRETFKEVWRAMELSRVIKNIHKSLESESGQEIVGNIAMIEEVGRGIVWSLERVLTFCIYCDMPKDIFDNPDKKRKLSK